MEILRFIFNDVLVNPMLNVLVLLYSYLFSSMGVAIIAFTVGVRVALLRLQLKQTRMMKALQAIQPKMKEVQERFKNDPQRRSREMMALYRREGVNPLGCLGPMFVQIPIWVGLYQALLKSLGTNPNDLVGLSQRIYSWNPVADSIIPLNANFLGLDLANPDPTRIIMPVLVGISTWALQKTTTPPSTDERQQSTANTMLWMMPLMLAFLSLTFPSGLALYWTISNAIGVAIHVYMTKDVGAIVPDFAKPYFGLSVPARADEGSSTTAIVEAPPPTAEDDGEPEEKAIDGTRTNDDGKNRRRSNRSGPERTRRRSGRGRGRNYKPR